MHCSTTGLSGCLSRLLDCGLLFLNLRCLCGEVVQRLHDSLLVGVLTELDVQCIQDSRPNSRTTGFHQRRFSLSDRLAVEHLIEEKAKSSGLPLRFAACKALEGDNLILDKLGLDENERDLLGSWVPLEQIGTHTISCALVKPTTSGGIQVRTANLNYITSNMIASNLATAGITNCEVVAAAPFEVSGTGALTGILMAYERSTSTALDQNKSNVAVQELVTTTDLANKVGQQEAQQIVNDIKLQIIEGNLEATDVEQVNQIVNDVITNYTDDSLIVYTDNSSTNTTVNNTTNNTVNNTTNNTVNNNTVNNTTNNTTTNVSNNTTNYTSGLSQEDIVQLQIFAANLAAQSYDEGTKAALAQIQQSLEQQTQKTSSAQTQDIVASVESEAEARQPVMEPEKEALNNILNQVNLDALANIPGMQGVVESSTDQSVLSESSNNLDVQIQEQYTAPAQEAVPDSAPAPNVDPEWQALNDQLNQENLEIASHIPGMEGISTEPQPEAAPTEQTDLATAKTAETP